jgi:hypothetical protein
VFSKEKQIEDCNIMRRTAIVVIALMAMACGCVPRGIRTMDQPRSVPRGVSSAQGGMYRLLALRGGGNESTFEFFSEDPRPSGPVRHLVPKHHDDLLDCVLEARSGDTIFLQGLPQTYRTIEGGEWGWHSWMGPVFVTNECLWRSRRKGFPHSGAKTLEELRQYYREADKAGKGLIKLEKTVIRGAGELHFAGAPGVKVAGQLVLSENTTGTFKGPMTLALLSDVNFLTGQNDLRYCSDMTAMLTVQGNSWSFHTCEIRASGGLALRCDRSALFKGEGCAIGGVLAYDVDGRLAAASRAISVQKHARCVLLGCSIEHTEVHKYDYRGGAAIKVCQGAEVVVEDSIFHSHAGVALLFDEFDDLGEAYHNAARVRIANCALKQCGVAVFSVRGDARLALLRFRNCNVFGTNVWANDDRPGSLEVRVRVRVRACVCQCLSLSRYPYPYPHLCIRIRMYLCIYVSMYLSVCRSVCLSVCRL